MNDNNNNSNSSANANDDENNNKDKNNDDNQHSEDDEECRLEHINNTSDDNDSNNNDVHYDNDDADSSNNASVVTPEEDEENEDYNSSSPSSWSNYDDKNNSNNSWNDSFSSSLSYDDNINDNEEEEVEEHHFEQNDTTIIASNDNNSFSSSDDNNNYHDNDNNIEYTITNNNNKTKIRHKRRNKINSDNDNDNNQRSSASSSYSSSKDNRKYAYRIKHNNNNDNRFIINKRKIAVNIILCISILLWIIAQTQYNSNLNNNTNHYNLDKYSLYKTLNNNNNNNNANKNLPEYILKLREEREIKAKLALGSGAASTSKHNHHYHSPTRNNFDKKRGGGGSREKPPLGCNFTKWQLLSYPNCNDVHTIHLPFDLNMQPPIKRNKKYIYYKPLLNITKKYEYGYIGSGLWRDVFKLPNYSEHVVLKIMKIEHDNDERNIDRHRRDALIMEQLTSNDNIITPYSYCGTSIITPFYDLRLDAYLYPSPSTSGEKHQYHKQIKSYNDDDNKISNINNNNDLVVLPSIDRNTEYGRINLAYQISKSIKALHTIPGPAVHADIQTKQFLIDSKTSTIILSDFNRCRFMASTISDNDKNDNIQNSKENKYCKFRIPSSPGKHRSPEEYNSISILSSNNDKKRDILNEKLDIFSLGHVFYTILTGLPAISTMEKMLPTKNIIKRSIANGVNPLTHTHKEKYVSTKSDDILWNIIERMYLFDIDKRISSIDIVDILENHLSTLTDR